MSGTGQPHPELGEGVKVRLRPGIAVGPDGTISRIAISGRTPSPFGRRMGDHTVAWQAVVDEVHALLYGKTLDDAVKALETAHEEAYGWMRTQGTPKKLLLRELDDIPSRWQRLEDATFYATQHLAAAAVTTTEAGQRRADLSRALAYHLAYLNYLPFETVPARSARGSHGSAEGRHRAVLVAYETERRRVRTEQEEEASRAPLPEDQPMQTETEAEERIRIEREQAEARAQAEAEKTRRQRVAPELLAAMWGLFDFAAALRESDLEYVLRPSAAADATRTRDQIVALAAGMNAAAKKLQERGAGAIQETGTALTTVRDQAAAIARRTDTYEVFTVAAGRIRDGAKAILDARITSGTIKTAAKKAVTDKKLAGALTEADRAAGELKAQADHAPVRAPRILAAVLRRHLTALAAAYPNSVVHSGLLDPTPAGAAYAKLYSVLSEGEYAGDLPGAQEALRKLQAAFIKEFGDGGIKIAASDAWIVDAGNSGLVVTWNTQTSQLDVNGRAAAPEGVAGMGSHTTAWVLECLALNAYIRGVTTTAAIPALLAEAVRDDLEGEVIQLDQLLPADQLEGNQLTDLFQAAADVLAATDGEAAGRSYLEFRNLLPFATVDEGGRGGHAERTEGTADELFDAAALGEAASNIVDALKNPARVKTTVLALRSAATRLRREADSTDTEWPADVKKAARKAADRLTTRAKNLGRKLEDNDLDTDADAVGRRIFKTRRSEHDQVYDLVHS